MLAGELRHRVRRERHRGHRLALRQLFRLAISRRRRGEEHALHARFFRGIEDVHRTVDVGRVTLDRVLDALGHRPERAFVEHDLDAGARFRDGLAIPDIAGDALDLGLVGDPVEVLPVTSRQVVEDTHVLAGSDERRDQVRADEACAAGNEISSLRHVRLPASGACLSRAPRRRDRAERQDSRRRFSMSLITRWYSTSQSREPSCMCLSLPRTSVSSASSSSRYLRRMTRMLLRST
jgi:hypothetical protein